MVISLASSATESVWNLDQATTNRSTYVSAAIHLPSFIHAAELVGYGMAWHSCVVGIRCRVTIVDRHRNEWMNELMNGRCDERNAIGDVVVPDCAKQVKWANIKGSRLLGVDWIWIPAQEISAILTFIQLCCIICDFAPHDRLSGLFVWSRFFLCNLFLEYTSIPESWLYYTRIVSDSVVVKVIFSSSFAVLE